MKKTRLSIFALGTLMLLGTGAFAQNRSIDLEPIIVSPAAGDSFSTKDTMLFQVDLKNNGPDGLVAGDTIAYIISTNPPISTYFALEQDVPSGETVRIINLNLTFTGGEAPTEPTETQVCVRIHDPNSAGLTDADSGDPILVSYDDGNLDNNETCNKVTVLPDDEVSIAKVNTESVLSLYPNPASTFVNFSVDNAGEATATIKDITGRTITTQYYGAVQANSNLEFNVSGLNAGMYIISVEVGGKMYTGKVTVQK